MRRAADFLSALKRRLHGFEHAKSAHRSSPRSKVAFQAEGSISNIWRGGNPHERPRLHGQRRYRRSRPGQLQTRCRCAGGRQARSLKAEAPSHKAPPKAVHSVCKVARMVLATVLWNSLNLCSQTNPEPAHPILPIPGNSNPTKANAILTTWTEGQYTNNFTPRQSPRNDDYGFVPSVVPGDTGWAWSESTPNVITSTPSGTVLPLAPNYVIKTQAVSVMSGKIIYVPYYNRAGSTTDMSLVFALIDYHKRRKLRSDFNILAPTYMASGPSHATRNQAYARRIAIALLDWARYFPDYYLTAKNSAKFINAGPSYVLQSDLQRASDHNGLAHEWEDDELLAFDAIYDSPALAALSSELGFDVRGYIKTNLFYNEGDFIVYHVPVDVAIQSNLSHPYTVLALVARVLNRPDYIIWLDRYLDATVRRKIRRDGTLSEGMGYSIGYINENLSAAKNTRDYFLTRSADTPDLLAISNRAHSYVARLEYGRAQWAAVALPNGQLPSFGDTGFKMYFTARNAGYSALLPAYGTLSLGTGSGSQAIQINQNYSGDNNHMRSDTTAFVLWAFGREILGNIRYHNRTPGRQFTEQILAYNAVTIDRTDMASPDADTYGNGDLTIYIPCDNGLGMSEIDGQRAYNNKATRYQRIMILNALDLARPYAVDIFRVAGGTNHDYVLHGPIQFDSTWECSFPLVTNPALYPMLEEGETWYEPTTSSSAFPYYGFWRSVSSNRAPGNFYITFRAAGGDHHDLRLWMTDDGTATVYLGMTPVPARTNSEPPNYWVNNLWRPSAIIRRRVPAPPLQSLFVGVIEPLNPSNGGRSAIQSVERLPVSGSEVGLEVVALRVRFQDGGTDTYVVNLRNPEVAGATGGALTVSTADGQFILTGRIGMYSARPTGLRVWTVNAAEFQYPGGSFITPGCYYSGAIIGETRKSEGAQYDALITTTPLPLGTTLHGKRLSLTFGTLVGTGTNGISEMFTIDRVVFTNGLYLICFTNDHMLEITNSTLTVEQVSPQRTFTGTNRFEIVLAGMAVPLSPTTDVVIPINSTSAPISFWFGRMGDTDGPYLSVGAVSDNQTLIPNHGLLWTGTGTNRTLTLVPAANQTGAARVTVWVTDGVWTNTRSFNVIVSDFVLLVSPSIQTIVPGSHASYTATVMATNGFADTVLLEVTGLPVGAAAAFDPPTLRGAGSSTLHVATQSNAPAGIYTLTLTAKSGALASTGTVTLVVVGPQMLRWDSRSSGLWDVGGSTNWVNLATGGHTPFMQGDCVLFDDTPGVMTNVIIGPGTTVMPGMILVEANTNNFTISGYGKIGGQASIIKSGTSVLTLSATNEFTGFVCVTSGVLKVSAPGALGSSAGATIATNGGTLDLNGQNLSAEPVIVSGAGANNQGAIVNTGPSQTTALKQVTLAGDTTFGGTGRWDIRGGGAWLMTEGRPVKITKVGQNQVSLVGVNPVDPALGDIDIAEGTFAVQTSTAQLGDSNCTITVFSGAKLNLWQLTTSPLNKKIVLRDGATIWNEKGPSIIIGPVTLLGTVTMDVSGNGTPPTLSISNVLSGPGGLIKLGGGTLILSHPNTYTGDTAVQAGTLALTGNGSILKSPLLMLAPGAKLDVSTKDESQLVLTNGQTLAGWGEVVGGLFVCPGATVSPGSTGQIGTLTITNAVALEGATRMKLHKAAGTNDVVRSLTRINFNGTLVITNLGGKLMPGDRFKLFDAPSYTGAFVKITPAIPGLNLGWYVGTLQIDGTLRVLSVPTTPPRIRAVRLDTSGILIEATEGVPDWPCCVLTSTNLALPITSWTRFATNVFDGSGKFTFTNSLGSDGPQRFYMLQLIDWP